MAESKPIRTFVIVHPDGTESGSYRGRSPRQAALKAINKNYPFKGNTCMHGCKQNPVTIKLRERGTKKVHVFKGYTEIVNSPENRPTWIPATIKVAHVEKIGIVKINNLGTVPALVRIRNIIDERKTEQAKADKLVESGVLTGEQLKEIEALPVPDQNKKVN